MGSQGPQCHGGCQKFHFREFSVFCSQTSSCARKPLVLTHRCIVYTSMWQVSSGLKEDEMGSQGPQCHGGCQKFHFREFSVSCSQTSSCARKPLVLRHRCTTTVGAHAHVRDASCFQEPILAFFSAFWLSHWTIYYLSFFSMLTLSNFSICPNFLLFI